MLRTLFLTALALGVVAALSTGKLGATSAAPSNDRYSAAGPTLSADLSAIKRDGPYLHVEARFQRAQSGDLVKVLPITLREGEQAAFSMPGFPEQTFRIERSGDQVVINVRTGRSILARVLG